MMALKGYLGAILKGDTIVINADTLHSKRWTIGFLLFAFIGVRQIWKIFI